MNEDKRDEQLGRAITGIAWIFFAVKFIAVVTLIALAVLWFLGKPLWLAPVIAAGVFIVYRLGLRLVGLFIGWSSKQ